MKDWESIAREHPDTPLSPDDAQDYLGHLVDSHNAHVRGMQAQREAQKAWANQPLWYRTMFFWMAP